jgi:SRSO17 transposase
LATEFHWEHFAYFRTLVLLIAFAWGRRNVSALCRYLDGRTHRHRSRFNNFLNRDRWDPEGALAKTAYRLVEALDPQPGEVMEFVLDDTKKGKRGKAMEAVGWIHDPTTGRKIRGHQYLQAVIRFRGHTIPFAVRLYVKKEDCRDLGRKFQKTTELAAELIRSFDPPKGVKVYVLFDSFYLCPTVVKACRSKGFHFVSTLKSNRNLYKNGRKLKAGPYGQRCFRTKACQRLILGKRHGTVEYRYVDAGWIAVSDLGPLHVVFSRKKQEQGILGLVSDDPDLSASGMIREYDGRWSIEVFWKDAKSLLGLGQYQNGSYRAAVIHLHLVCFAYALLTHIAIQREGAQGRRRKKRTEHLSTAQLQNELRRIVWEDLADYLRELPSGDSVVKELGRLLMAS